MISKALPLRSVSATINKARYVADADAPSHKDLRNIETRFYGLDAETIAGAMREFEERALGIRTHGRGRPKEVVAYHLIARTPKGAHLDGQERKRFEKETLKEFGIRFARVGWHIHRDGSADIHIIALNETHTGKALKSAADPRVRYKLIAVMDRTQEEINAERAKTGRTRIETVRDVRRRIARDRRRETLSDLLLRKSKEKGVTDWKEIKKQAPTWIKEAGHKVTRCNDRTISIEYAGTKKAMKHNWENIRKAIEQMFGKKDKPKIDSEHSSEPKKEDSSPLAKEDESQGKTWFEVAVPKEVPAELSPQLKPKMENEPLPAAPTYEPYIPITEPEVDRSWLFKHLLELGYSVQQARAIVRLYHQMEHFGRENQKAIDSMLAFPGKLARLESLKEPTPELLAWIEYARNFFEFEKPTPPQGRGDGEGAGSGDYWGTWEPDKEDPDDPDMGY